MNARHQAAGASGGEDFARLRDGEGAAIAEYIAEFGETRHRYRGNPAFYQQIHVGFGTAAEFRGNHMRAKERRMDIERVFLMQLGKQRENFELSFPVDTRAFFGFDGGGAVGGEQIQIGDRSLFKRVRSGSAQTIYRRAYPAAFLGDFFVAGAGDAL